MNVGNHSEMQRVQRRMRLRRAVPLCLVVALLGGCGGTSTATRVASTAPVNETSTPTALTCPSGEQVEDPGGLVAKPPHGYGTQEQAIEAWLRDNDWAGDAADFVLATNGKSAWIVREDGTATAHVQFVRHDGFTVYGYQACSS